MSTELQVFDSLKAEVQVFVGPAMGARVTDAASSQAAIDALKTVKLLTLQLEKKRKEIVTPLNDRVKAVNSYAKGIEDPLTKAERHLKSEVARFEDELERARAIKAAEERRIREDEERKARAEQARIQAEIEEKRQAEIEALKETASMASEAAAFFGDSEPAVDLAAERRRIDQDAERERIEAQARLDREQSERERQAEGRQWDIDNARTKGAKKVWDFEVLDLSAVPRDYLKIEINRAAVLAAARGGITNIPGVRVFQKTEIVVGAHTRIPEALLEEKG